MKTYIYKSFLVFLCLCLLLSVAGCSKEKTTVITNESGEEVEPLVALSTGADYLALGTSQNMDLVAENDQYQLLLDPQTATVAVYVKATGHLWKSNLSEDEAEGIVNEDVKYEYMSQVLISYYNSSNSEVIYDSYRYSVLSNDAAYPTLAYYSLDNGLRVAYTIGQSIDYFYMPAVLTEEYFQELTGLMNPDDAEMFGFLYEPLVYDEVSKELIDSYKLQYKNFAPGDTIYQLATNSKMVKTQYYNDYLKDLGVVDDEYIDDAYNAAGYSYVRPDIPQFTLALDYTLTDAGLTVNVPLDQVIYDKVNFRLHGVEILPFFGAVTDDKDVDLFLPDGSGAIISSKTDTKASISLPFYGKDNSLWTEETAQNMQQAALPIYGINRGDNAFVAYVSDGESVGAVECHPKNSVYPYAYIGGSYTIHPFETYASNGASARATMQKYASDPYEGNVTVNYMFLTGKELTYVDMAHRVQQYVFGSHDRVSDDSLRFYLETYGEVLRKENFLGYAYNKDTALTTFEQAQTIYDHLNANGITNIAVRYNNWYGDAYTNKIAKIGKVSKAIGGASGLKDFIAYVSDKGGVVYPNAELIKEKFSLSLSDATWHSKFIEGTMVSYAKSDLYSKGVTADFDQLIVKSDVALDKLPGIQKKLKKLGINAVSLSTVGDQMFSDFTEDEIRFRDAVQEDMVAILEATKADNKVMVDIGNAYVLPYADDIMNVPMGCSNLSFEKIEVPFMQIVLHGYVSYSGSPLNLSDDYQMQLLKSVEYGGNLAYTLNYATAEMVKNTNYSELYSTNFDFWKDKTVADFKSVAAVLDGCQGSTITNHQMLADDVYMTTYENGAQVVVNYSDASFVHNGVTVSALGFARVDKQ